jgi:hypothetical protein
MEDIPGGQHRHRAASSGIERDRAGSSENAGSEDASPLLAVRTRIRETPNAKRETLTAGPGCCSRPVAELNLLRPGHAGSLMLPSFQHGIESVTGILEFDIQYRAVVKPGRGVIWLPLCPGLGVLERSFPNMLIPVRTNLGL